MGVRKFGKSPKGEYSMSDADSTTSFYRDYIK